jgi:hypothetical protein
MYSYVGDSNSVYICVFLPLKYQYKTAKVFLIPGIEATLQIVVYNYTSWEQSNDYPSIDKLCFIKPKTVRITEKWLELETCVVFSSTDPNIFGPVV